MACLSSRSPDAPKESNVEVADVCQRERQIKRERERETDKERERESERERERDVAGRGGRVNQ